MKNIKTFEDFFNNRENAADVNEEAEGKMYKGRLKSIISNAQKFMDMLGDEEDMEAWVQDKIVIADHNMEAIAGYYQSEKGDKDKAEPNIEKPIGPANMIIDKR